MSDIKEYKRLEGVGSTIFMLVLNLFSKTDKIFYSRKSKRLEEGLKCGNIRNS